MREALVRECARYDLDYDRIMKASTGAAPPSKPGRTWWDYAIIACALGVFVWLGINARIPSLAMNLSMGRRPHRHPRHHRRRRRLGPLAHHALLLDSTRC